MPELERIDERSHRDPTLRDLRMDAVAALSAPRRREGFISVIAGFSFLGIMLGVAVLIIVMAVMNGFRKELLDKIPGSTAICWCSRWNSRSPTGTWWRNAFRRARHPPAAPIVEGQALASSPFHSAGVLVRGIRAAGPRQAQLDRQQPEAGDAGGLRRPRPRDRAAPVRPALGAPATTSRWCAARRRHADGHDAADQDLQGRGGVRDRHVGIRPRSCSCRCRKRSSISTAAAT